MAFVLAVVWVPESSDRQGRRIDVLGFVFGAAFLACMSFAVIQGEDSGYTAPWIVTLFVLCGLSGVAFVVTERRVKSPMLELTMFRRPPFTGSIFVAFVAYFGTFSIFFFTALYLQVVVGASAYQTAVDFLPMAAGLIIVSALTGPLVARVHFHRDGVRRHEALDDRADRIDAGLVVAAAVDVDHLAQQCNHGVLLGGEPGGDLGFGGHSAFSRADQRSRIVAMRDFTSSSRPCETRSMNAAPRTDQSTLLTCSIMTAPVVAVPTSGTRVRQGRWVRVTGQTTSNPVVALKSDPVRTNAGRFFACSRPACGSKFIQARSPRSGT